jgi:hypothetical protein
MPMISRRLAVAAGMLFTTVITNSVAMAACAGPRVNPDATDPMLRQLVAGTWYGVNEQMGMRQQLYATYLPTGVFEYRDQTCGATGCSENYGHGFWMATRQADGAIYIRIQFSDLKRTNECTGIAASFTDRDTMVFQNGGRAQRVQ